MVRGEALSGFLGVIVAVKKKKTRREKKKEETCTAPKAEASLTLYPNPLPRGSLQKIQVLHLEPGTYQAEVYTLAGVLVQAQETVLNKNGQAGLTWQPLPGGTYVLRLTHARSGRQVSRQFLILE
jgi:hypothetical protein